MDWPVRRSDSQDIWNLNVRTIPRSHVLFKIERDDRDEYYQVRLLRHVHTGPDTPGFLTDGCRG
jgi:hypothetical protein